MRLSILIAIILAVSSTAHAKRAFTIDDLYQIRNVGDAQISPDGMHIALRATTYTLSEGKSNADIYIINADGSHLRRMTTSDKSDSHPRWSPDGRSLLFVSTRKDGPQVWRIPVDGGEATQVTDFPPGVNDPIWAPDGKRVFFFSEVFPECGADPDCNEDMADDMKSGPTQAHLADDLFYRHWTIWRDGKRFHVLSYDLTTKTYTDHTPGKLDFPAYLTGRNAGYDVSPDGSEICVATNPDKDPWQTTNEDLFVVPVGGGDPVNITASNHAYDGNPTYSSDGRYIAYLKQLEPRYESDRIRLAVYDRRKKKSIVLTGKFDNWVEDFHWAPDSKGLYFLAAEEGARPMYRVDISSKKIHPVVDLRYIDAFDVSPDGKWIAAGRRSVGEPREIWSCTTTGSKIRRLTTFNKPVEDAVDIRPAEEMWIESPTGSKIQTFLVKPHNFDPGKKYPLILNVHGGPQSQWTDAFRGDWQVYPGAGYIVAFPNPHGSTGFGQKFTREISRDWGGKVYRDVMAVADSLSHLPWVDRNRMGAMGWSFGGYMMMWLEGHTTRFRCIASMMGVYDLPAMWGSTEELWFPQFDLGGRPWESDDYRTWSPNQYAQNFKTPCLVITGEGDYRVPYTQSLEFYTALRSQGITARLIVFKNDGHWPNWVKSMPVYYNAHLDLFHKYLGGGKAPYDTRAMVHNRAFHNDEDSDDDE